jgi:hypothetical protein
MKKGRGLARAVPPLSREALEALPTRALLARLERLRWCEEARGASDLTEEEASAARHLILFKEEAAWRSAYADVKAVLAGREHVEGKP